MTHFVGVSAWISVVTWSMDDIGLSTVPLNIHMMEEREKWIWRRWRRGCGGEGEGDIEEREKGIWRRRRRKYEGEEEGDMEEGEKGI